MSQPKKNYLETHFGSRLVPLGIHPTINSMVMVETADGFKTTVCRSDLIDNEVMRALVAGTLTDETESSAAAGAAAAILETVIPD